MGFWIKKRHIDAGRCIRQGCGSPFFFEPSFAQKRNGVPEDTTSHQLKSQYFEQ
jgi:hypothetical protein